jgi:predicted transcriptional regulator
VVEGMADTIREMEERLDEQVKANVKLQNRLNESKKQVILNNISEGLVDTQKDKLAALAEGVDFVSEEEFSRKLNTIKESYFPKEKTTVSEVSDETPVESEVQSPAMAAYLQALSRWSN